MGEAGMSDDKLPWAGAEADLSGASLEGADLGVPPAAPLAHPDVQALVEAAEDVLRASAKDRQSWPALRSALAKLKGAPG